MQTEKAYQRDQMLTTSQVAEILNVPVQTLHQWRHYDSCKLPYRRLGQRLIRYAKSDVLEFLEASKIESRVDE